MALRCYGGGPHVHLRSRNLPFIHTNDVSSDRLRGRQDLRGCRSHCTRHALIYIRHVVDRRLIHHHRVVVVVHHGCVYRRVCDVHVVHVVAAYPVGRNVNFTRSQREPADSRTTSDCNADGYVRSANPSDKRGCVNRTRVHHTHRCGPARHPAPRSANSNPAAVVEWSEAPRLIIDPRIAPRRDPHPVPVAIGRPTYHRRLWKPDSAVLARVAPSSILIEVLISDGILRNVPPRRGTIFASVTFVGPALQIVVATHTLDIGVQLIGAAKYPGLVGVHAIGLPATGDFSFSIANDNYGGVARFIHVDSVNARTRGCKSQIRCINLENFAATETPQTNSHRSFRQLQLRGVVVQIQKRKTSVRAQANRARTDLQLCPGITVSPKLVSSGHGPVHHSTNPVLRSCRLKGNRSIRNAETSHACGRIIVVRCGSRRTKQCHGQCHGDQACKFERIFSHNQILS